LNAAKGFWDVGLKDLVKELPDFDLVIDGLRVTTQVYKTVSCDFAISARLDPERTMSQTGNLTVEYAEGRGGRING